MRKNSLLILTLSVLMLTACGGTSSQTSSSQSPVSSSGSSESVSTDSTSSPTDSSAKLQAAIDALSGNNFTTKYFMGTQTSEKDAFYTYRDNRYFFDTYNQTGYIALEVGIASGAEDILIPEPAIPLWVTKYINVYKEE